MTDRDKRAMSKIIELVTESQTKVSKSDKIHRPKIFVVSVSVVFVLALIWMMLASVDQVVRAYGRIIPTSKAQVIQHLEGGIVSAIHVHEGQLVDVNSELVSISDVQANSQLGERKVKKDALQAQVARLEAEAQGNPFDTHSLQIDDASVLEREYQVYVARQEKLSQSLSVLRAQYEQRRQELAEIVARKQGAVKEQAIAKQQLAVTMQMIERQAASKLELLEAQGRSERLDSQLRELDASIPKLRAAVQELASRISETNAQFKAEARNQLSEAQIELSRVSEEVNAGNDRLQRTEVKSPVKGTVNRIYISTIGGVIRAGDPLMEITPVGDNLTIEARISPQDRAEIRPGMRSVIRISAFDYAIYGSLTGKVTEISADTIADEKGERYYRVQIDIDPKSYQGFRKRLGPGMTATADIVMGNRTIFQYLMSPMTRFMSEALRDKK